MRNACIALLSDFGSRDVYAGVMKGVITGIAPHARFIDLTHEIPPGDVRQAAVRLWQALPHMPQGTIFLAVVDPGVGTTRRPIAVQCKGFLCVGPDNGIFTYVLRGRSEARAVVLSSLDALPGPGSKSSTFHGRDIFAPAAGFLASGTNIRKLGTEAADLLAIPWPRLVKMENEKTLRGETLFADRFGNMVTSIGALIRADDVVRLEPWVPAAIPLVLPADHLKVSLGNGLQMRVARTFADVPKGVGVAYIGSDNLLEIGVNQGSAVDSLALASGMEVSLTWF